MKKVVVLAVVLVSVLFLTSCTEDKDLKQIEEIERNLVSEVDRGEIDRPGNQGSN